MKNLNQMLSEVKAKISIAVSYEYSQFKKKSVKIYLCELSQRIDLFVKRIENNNFVIKAKSVLETINSALENRILTSKRLYRRYVIKTAKFLFKDYRYRCLMLKLIYEYNCVMVELRKQISLSHTYTGVCSINYVDYKKRLMYLVKAQKKLKNNNKEQVFYLINTYTNITRYSLENRYGIV